MPTQEEVKEKYEKLPKDLQKALFSVDSSTAIREIGQKHKLMIDKIGGLAEETGFVIFGMTHPKDFVSKIAARLKIDKQTAKKIAEDVNSRIFAPVRNSLKKLHNIKQDEIIEKEREKETADFTKEKEEVLNAIEKDEVPVKQPGVFEPKMQEKITRAPLEVKEPGKKPLPTKQYFQGDPYREPIE